MPLQISCKLRQQLFPINPISSHGSVHVQVFTALDWPNIDFLRLCSLCFAVDEKGHFKIVQDHQSTEMIKSASLLGFYAIIRKNIEAQFPNITFVNLEFPRMQMLPWLRRRLALQSFAGRQGIKRDKLLLRPCLFSNSQNKYLCLLGLTFRKENTQAQHQVLAVPCDGREMPPVPEVCATSACVLYCVFMVFTGFVE